MTGLRRLIISTKTTSGKDLQLLVYSPGRDLIKTFNIPDGGEVKSHTTMDEGIGIFQFANNENQLGDSISVKFSDNRCISYLRSVPDKIFDVKQYDNYSKELLEQGRFSLIYSITTEDYDGAGVCGR